MRVAIDIDDTLYSFTQLARETLIKLSIERNDSALRRAAYCSWVEWRLPDDLLGEEQWFEIINECHKPEAILAQPPYKGAADTLWGLRQAGYDLTYISSRHPDRTDATAQWLRLHDFPLGDRLLCDFYHSKSEQTADCDYMIDDRPKNLIEFAYDPDGTERTAFGLLSEYNRSLTDVPRIYLAPNWGLLRHYLLEKEVLPCLN